MGSVRESLSPVDLILVRHGQSEGNRALKAARNGDFSYLTPEFLRRSGRDWQLTDLGRDQARVAGEWIRNNVPGPFDFLYSSSYVRAMQTASLLGIDEPGWRTSEKLRERDWGARTMPNVNGAQIEDLLAHYREVDSLLYRPYGGETLNEVRGRIGDFNGRMRILYPRKRGIVVVHGEVMWCFRAENEHMDFLDWLETERDPAQKILNCHVIWFSKRNPERPTEIANRYAFTRRVCPEHPESTDTGWLEIPYKKTLTSDELMSRADEMVRVLGSIAAESS